MQSIDIRKSDVDPNERQLLTDLKASLSRQLGRKLRGIVLFGSKARGDAEPHSDFVKTGFFAPADSHTLARIMKYREEADYSPSFMFTVDDCGKYQGEVKALSMKIGKFHKTKGYATIRRI